MTLTLGYKASAEQFAPRELVEISVLAEHTGMQSVFVSDHFQPWRHTGGHAPFSVAWMSAVGERTTSVVLGTSVLTPTFRYNPAVVAQAFATMGCLYPGRVVLGIGTGEALNEVAVSAAPWPGFKERFARLREAVELMRMLWAGERVTFDGEYYRTVDATVYDRPDQPVPVYVAAGGPVVARYAGRAGDGFICTSGKGMDLYLDKLLPAVDEGRSQAPPSGAAFQRVLEVKLSFDLDARRALDDTGFWAPLSLSAEEKSQLEDPLAMERAADALPAERVASRWIVASDPDEVVQRLQPYVDAGFDHLVFHSPARDQPRFLAQFETHLAAKVRGMTAATQPRTLRG
jgi:coenzyme F420-dependent glucose-6-phosphate dehydrogenase